HRPSLRARARGHPDVVGSLDRRGGGGDARAGRTRRDVSRARRPPWRRRPGADRVRDCQEPAMPYRVIQWATGNVGRAAVEGIVSHPELELVGTWVHSADKSGRDVGELCGIGPLGVRATSDVDAILALDADCVLYSPLLPQLDEVV